MKSDFSQFVGRDPKPFDAHSDEQVAKERGWKPLEAADAELAQRIRDGIDVHKGAGSHED